MRMVRNEKTSGNEKGEQKERRGKKKEQDSKVVNSELSNYDKKKRL
jgi:hypothetical protein